MATPFSSFSAPIVSSASPPNQSYRWWTSEPDYISCGAKIEAGRVVPGSGRIEPNKDLFRGQLTEEKAKELRRKTIQSSTFHDVMYHSAIASRLASDVAGR